MRSASFLGLRMDREQAMSQEVFQKFEQIALAQFAIDVIFANDLVANVGDANRFLNQLPDACANLIQTVIHAGGKIQDHHFAGQFA
jgi:hypothetical protein